MAELKIEIPEELREDMNKFPEIGWQKVVRNLIKQELDRLTELKNIISKSRLTENDVKELSEKVDTSLSQRFKQSLKG